MSVPRQAIQPTAEKLVSYQDFVERLQQLATSPRVKIERLGESHGKRGIYAIVISDEQGIDRLDHYRTLAVRLERPQVTHKTLLQAEQEDRPVPPADMRYPVLVVAHTFGHEAAHLEALLELADKLAWSSDQAVQDILARLIVVIVPLANPDGRESALRHWAANPLGEDSPAAGNHYGFYLNRDILHLTQPEGRAVLRAFQNWHPLAVYDSHEDAYLLGVLTPEVCWCPAFGNASGGDLPDNIQQIIEQLSKAIIKAWDAHGYHYYHGDMFGFPMIGQPTDKPYWFAQGNVIITMGMHGIPAVITESSRTPGSQSWEDRLGQKVTASLALLGEAASTANAIADTMYRNAAALIAQAGHDAYIVPKNQPDVGALAKLIDTLIQQEVRVYETDQPEPAFVIPLAQAETRIALELLSAEASKLMAMPPAIGVNVLRLSKAAPDVRKGYENAPLTPVTEAPVPGLKVTGQPTQSGHFAIPNTVDSVRLVNRLLAAGVTVDWLADTVAVKGQTFSAGTFIVENTALKTLEVLARRLHLTLTEIAKATSVTTRSLRKPRVAVYLGQGVDRPDSVPKAEMWWGMEQLGFEFTPLFGKQMSSEWLDRCDILIMPDGDPNDIVRGWQRTSRANSDAWDRPGEPDGIGQDGLTAIREFVTKGGSYLGIGSGGGLLATADYTGLVNVSIAHHSLGSARVILRVSDLSSPLVYGLTGNYAEDGKLQTDTFAAMYYTESLAGSVGGPLFKVEDGAQAIAYFQAVEHDPKTHYVIHPELFDEKNRGVAIVYQKVGKGSATIISVRPGFRAWWTNTYKLLSNSIFDSVAGDVKTSRLP